MPQDTDIASQWKSFDPARRERLLAKMTPEQKTKLRSTLEGGTSGSPWNRMAGASGTATASPTTAESVIAATPAFLKAQYHKLVDRNEPGPSAPGFVGHAQHALDEVQATQHNVRGRAVQGIVEAVRHPVDTLTGIAKTAVELNPAYQAASAAGVVDEAEMPVQQRVQEFADEWKRNPREAMENAAGDYVGGEAAGEVLRIPGKVLTKGIEPVAGLPKVEPTLTPGALRRAAQKVIVGGRPVNKLVDDTLTNNAAAAEKAAKETEANKVTNAKREDLNRQREQQHAAAVKKTVAKNATTVEAHQANVGEHIAGEEKSIADRKQAVADQQAEGQRAADTERVRQQTLEEHEKLSREHVESVKAAEAKANAENDAAWVSVREKAGSEVENIEPVKQIAAGAADKVDPVSSPIFKSIANTMNEELPEIVVEHKPVAPGAPNYDMYYEMQYGEPPPLDAGDATANFTRLHRWYSYLGDKMYAGNLDGTTYNAFKRVRQAVDDSMQKIAQRTGAADDLAKARELHTSKMETFSDSPNEPATNASKSVKETTGKFVEEEARKKRLEMQARYDSTIPARAERIRSLQQTLDELPTQKQTAATNKPEPPHPTPTPQPKMGQLRELPKPKPKLPMKPESVAPNIQRVGPEEVRQSKLGALNKQIDWIHHRGKWIASGAAFSGTLYHILQGNVGGVAESIATAGAALVATDKIAAFLERPAVQEWLTRPEPSDMARLNRLPPEQRAVVAEGLQPAIDAARAKGIKVSPVLLAYVGGIQNAGDAKKRVAELRAKN